MARAPKQAQEPEPWPNTQPPSSPAARSPPSTHAGGGPSPATWLKARALIREGAVGKVLQVQLDDGGNILNTNSHNIRLALFLMDEPKVTWVTGAVERTTDQAERGLPAEDACLGLAGCDNG